MISGYIQLFFSVFLIGCMLYIIVKFIQTVNHDLHMKAEEYSTEIIYQVSECSKLYLLNKCDPKTRVMHMEKTCKEWEICMARDPKEIGRLKVGAETLAEILNNLIEPLSYKTMAFGTILLFGSIFLMTTALGSVKTKVGRDPYPHPPSMHPFSGSPYAYHMMSQPPGGGMMFGEHFGSGLGVASGRRSGGLYSTPTRRLGSPRSASSPRKLRDSRAIGYDEANVED
ncbi:hypothetical protein HK104_004514 [Borealophlyctis nickersoniae]|nr:hypothetical protein HK104_004514 [Borealophlyctis nickersoniae]